MPKYIYAYLPNWKAIGYMHHMELNVINAGSEDDPDTREWLPFGVMPKQNLQAAWICSAPTNVEEAVTQLREWMRLIGLRGEPATSDIDPDYALRTHEPAPSKNLSGEWTLERVQEVVFDELRKRGVVLNDIDRSPNDEEYDYSDMTWTWNDHIYEDQDRRCSFVALEFPDCDEVPILPSTKEDEIRHWTSVWLHSVISAWKYAPLGAEDVEYTQQELLPATYAKWTKKNKDLLDEKKRRALKQAAKNAQE